MRAAVAAYRFGPGPAVVVLVVHVVGGAFVVLERLGVSVRTVDNHLASVYRKLGISGRAELESELRERR